MKRIMLFSVIFLGACTTLTSDDSAVAVDYSLFSTYQTQADLPAPSQLSAKRFSAQEIDLRSADLKAFDFSSYSSGLANYLMFDSKTQWPSADKLPAGFVPEAILQQGKNPGLHVRSLHVAGITGAGVSLAIIDQPLLTTHQEYADRIALYESQNAPETEASMHGAAVTSIAAGHTVGVAPEANVYYISALFHEDADGRFDARPITKALKRVYKINKKLPQKEKIRVVSISRGFGEQDIGWKAFAEIRRKLEKAGVAVLTTDSPLFTLSRQDAFADADDNISYNRAAYWFFAKNAVPSYEKMTYILFPTDYRSTASPTGAADYVFYANGGLSWAVPYAAGLYALGVQVYPALTPALFWSTLQETSAPAQVEAPDGKTYSARYLVQPVAFVKKLQSLQ